MGRYKPALAHVAFRRPLADVDYVIEARFEMTDRASADDNRAKFVEMFRRRLESGQHYHQPYFGCREFVAELQPVGPETPEPIDETINLGMMLYDIDFRPGRNRAMFFPARLERGVLEVPADLHAATAAGGAR